MLMILETLTATDLSFLCDTVSPLHLQSASIVHWQRERTTWSMRRSPSTAPSPTVLAVKSLKLAKASGEPPIQYWRPISLTFDAPVQSCRSSRQARLDHAESTKVIISLQLSPPAFLPIQSDHMSSCRPFSAPKQHRLEDKR